MGPGIRSSLTMHHTGVLDLQKNTLTITPNKPYKALLRTENTGAIAGLNVNSHQLDVNPGAWKTQDDMLGTLFNVIAE